MKTVKQLLSEAGYLASSKDSRKMVGYLNKYSKDYKFEMSKDESFGGITVYNARTGKSIGDFPNLDEILWKGLK